MAVDTSTATDNQESFLGMARVIFMDSSWSWIFKKRRRKMSSLLSADGRSDILDSIGHGKLEENSHDS